MALRASRSIWAEEEKGVLQASGVASTGSLIPWSMGRWRLDSTTLQFKSNGPGKDLSIPLATIRRIEQSRRKFLVVSKPVLILTHRPPRASRPARVWLLVGDLDLWRECLCSWTPDAAGSPAPSQASRAALVSAALEGVGGPVARVLDVLAGGPASSATLAGVLELDQEAALELPDVLRAAVADIEVARGAPVISYERHRFDPRTGSVHSMNWWLDGLVKGIWLTLRTPLEIHADELEVVAITSVPTRMTSSSVSVSICDDGLGLLLTGAGDYCRFIALPVAVGAVVEVALREHGTLAVRAAIRSGDFSDST